MAYRSVRDHHVFSQAVMKIWLGWLALASGLSAEGPANLTKFGRTGDLHQAFTMIQNNDSHLFAASQNYPNES